MVMHLVKLDGYPDSKTQLTKVEKGWNKMVYCDGFLNIVYDTSY